MPGSFSLKKFLDIDLNDPFFDSLKADYPVGGNRRTSYLCIVKRLIDCLG